MSTDIAREVERLIQFGLKHGMVEELDIIPLRNSLLDLLNLSEPFNGEIEEELLESPVPILDNILDYGVKVGILPRDTVTYRDLLDARIMGLLMPKESEVVKKFYEILKTEGAEKATDYFYALSKASNYIRMDRIGKNLYWVSKTEYGDLEITINLSKPEKDPKEIAEAKKMQKGTYPKCLLCLENVGYAGNLNHPARQNHRVIPMILNKEQWYLQYSPYVYYNEHCIAFYKEHVPMKICHETFLRLFDFVEQFPHYFMGSNADIPIVGGSILAHEHFQGGCHVFPMERAPVERFFIHKNFPNVKAGVVKWPLSVIRIWGNDREQLTRMASMILSCWRNYSDEEEGIIAYTISGEGKTPHNTITPIARKNRNGEFELDLTLRNNRTSEQYPEGIFHPHRELHHIKKENIGLIEVMGLAVLPGRLSRELCEIKKILTKATEFNVNMCDNTLKIHLPWIEEMLKSIGGNLSEDEADSYIKNQVGQKFLQVLLDAGVYKRTEKGQRAFDKFLYSVGFVEDRVNMDVNGR